MWVDLSSLAAESAQDVHLDCRHLLQHLRLI